MRKAVVLLSGGQDSTTCLYWAQQNFDEIHAVSVDYGQKHAVELECARAAAARVGAASHSVYNVDFFKQIGDSALLAGSANDPGGEEGGRADAMMPQGLPPSFVPGRNLFFLTLAAAVAVKLGARDIVTGVCQMDYSGYPDCRREFIDAFEKASTLAMPSSTGPLRVITPLMEMTKAETVHLARRLPGCWEALADTVTCYNGKRPGCGVCHACELREKGFVEAGFPDPARQ